MAKGITKETKTMMACSIKDENPLKNNQGIAIMMVLSTIVILVALIGTITYSNFLHTLIVYNKNDQMQAQINAESGLSFALGRLSIYQSALNILEKNPSRKKMVKPDDLNLIWSTPFIFPIPLGKNASIIQKDALKSFEKNTFLEGGMQTSIQNISIGINLNLLRLIPKKSNPQENIGGDDNFDSNDNPIQDDYSTVTDSKSPPHLIIKKRLVELLAKKMEEAREKFENYEEIYGDYTPDKLITAIQYYVNDPNMMENSTSDISDIVSYYQEIKAKHAPLSSMSELHLIYPWNDALIKLIEGSVTVHGNSSIDLNKMTQDTLKMIIPEIQQQSIKEFFEYRDDPKDPHLFLNKEEFIRYISERAQIIDRETLTQRMNQMEAASITFGPTGSLFKIISKGIYGRRTFTIEAIVSIPAYIEPEKPPRALGDNGKCPQGYEQEDPPKNPNMPCVEIRPKDDQNRPLPRPIEYLAPRVVELLTK